MSKRKYNEAAAAPPQQSTAAKELLNRIHYFLKNTVDGVLQLPRKVARALTIKEKPDQEIDGQQIQQENNPNINRPSLQAGINDLSISIGDYIFTLVSKLTMFDRRFVNFDVYIEADGNDDDDDADIVIIIINETRWKLLHTLTAYGSSSQVGSWRLCKNEDGNRLNKFDDYVQSTVIQWELSRFICYWFYRYQLPWDNEKNDIAAGTPLDPSRPDITLSVDQARAINLAATTRNNTRNNLFGSNIAPPEGYTAHTIPNPANIPPIAAIPYVYVMEGGRYQYLSLPIHYSARTQPDPVITGKIVGRGLGAKNIQAPGPFDYWESRKGHGKCGDPFGEPLIMRYLNEFSDKLSAFYKIEEGAVQPREPEPERNVITELYRDCMVYKNFKQEATIFKVKLIANEQNPISEPVEFNNQSVDLVFVNYSIKQWLNPDIKLPPCYGLDPQPIPPQPIPDSDPDPGPKFNVQGYYVLTIIPTKVLLPPPNNVIRNCNFDNITEIGLFENYIKAGFYACKPLDYKGQCVLRTFFPQTISTINLEYAFIGHRLNGQWPFYDLFGFNTDDRQILSAYTENLITLKVDPGSNMTRSATLARTDASSGNTEIIEYIDPKLFEDVQNYTNTLCTEKEFGFDVGKNVSKKTKTGKSRNNKKGGHSNKTLKRKRQKKRKTMKKQRQKKRKTKKMFKT